MFYKWFWTTFSLGAPEEIANVYPYLYFHVTELEHSSKIKYFGKYHYLTIYINKLYPRVGKLLYSWFKEGCLGHSELLTGTLLFDSHSRKSFQGSSISPNAKWPITNDQNHQSNRLLLSCIWGAGRMNLMQISAVSSLVLTCALS